MRLHVLAGCRDLLRPETLPKEELAALFGPRLRIATAFWLSPRCGPYYHDFLLEPVEDRRVEVFARALRDNFGDRFEPLITLPDLLGGASAAAPEAPQAARAMLLELWRHQPAEAMVLHAVALPDGLDGGDGWVRESGLLAPATRDRLERLRAAFAEGGVPAVASAVTEVGPDQPGFAVLLRNAVAQQVALRIGPRLVEEGLHAEPAMLQAPAARVLAGWHRTGITPARPIDRQSLDRLSGRILQTLFARRAGW